MTRDEATAIIGRRHCEWTEYHVQWRWLLDSYEGGPRYRDATYGTDIYRYPLRNLRRHKREVPYGPESVGPTSDRPDENDDFAVRLSRTPVPSMVADGIDTHIAKVFKEGVKRNSGGVESVESSWADMDGRGTPVRDWVAREIGPMFFAQGQADILADRPMIPDGETVDSNADEVRLGLDRAILSYILPENLVWWRLSSSGNYEEILILESDDDGSFSHEADESEGYGPAGQHPYAGRPLSDCDYFRYWSAAQWAIISHRGKVIREGANPYGCVPVERVLFRRKVRCRNVGHSFYGAAADLQREVYNRDSELILSDTTQAHPLLQGPEDYVQADGTVPIGPSWLLPKKKNTSGGTATYEGFSVVDFPKGTSESLRTNIADLTDRADRSMRLIKPAGSATRSGSTVSQSGISKAIDNDAAHASYADHASALERLERAAVRLILVVAHAGNRASVDADLARVEIIYPSEFGLDDAADLEAGLGQFQELAAGVAVTSEIQIAWLQQIVRAHLKGRSAETYAAYDAEIRAMVKTRLGEADMAAETVLVLPSDPAVPEVDDPSLLEVDDPADRTMMEEDSAGQAEM